MISPLNPLFKIMPSNEIKIRRYQYCKRHIFLIPGQQIEYFLTSLCLPPIQSFTRSFQFLPIFRSPFNFSSFICFSLSSARTVIWEASTKNEIVGIDIKGPKGPTEGTYNE